MNKIFIFYILITIITYLILQWNCFSWNPIWNFLLYLKNNWPTSIKIPEFIKNIPNKIMSEPNITCEKYPGCSFFFYTFTFLIFYFILSLFPSYDILSKKMKITNLKSLFFFLFMFFIILILFFTFIQNLEKFMDKQKKEQWIGFFLWLCCMFFYSCILLPFYIIFKIEYQLFHEITIVNILYFFILSFIAFYFPSYVKISNLWIPFIIGCFVIIIGRTICSKYFKIKINPTLTIFSYVGLFFFGFFIWYLISPYQDNKNTYNIICNKITQNKYHYFAESFQFFQNLPIFAKKYLRLGN